MVSVTGPMPILILKWPGSSKLGEGGGWEAPVYREIQSLKALAVSAQSHKLAEHLGTTKAGKEL